MIISFIYYVTLSKFVDSSFPQYNVHKGKMTRLTGVANGLVI